MELIIWHLASHGAHLSFPHHSPGFSTRTKSPRSRGEAKQAPVSEIHFPHSDILFPGISKNLSIFCLVLDPNHPDLNKEMVLPTRILK